MGRGIVIHVAGQNKEDLILIRPASNTDKQARRTRDVSPEMMGRAADGQGSVAQFSGYAGIMWRSFGCGERGLTGAGARIRERRAIMIRRK